MRRINFMVDKDLFVRFASIPWGQRSLLLRKMVEVSCLAWEYEGHSGLARVLEAETPFTNRVQNLNKSAGR